MSSENEMPARARAATRKLILLHELPSPSSDWTARQPHARGVARMTKRRLAPDRCGQERLAVKSRHLAHPTDEDDA